MRADPGHMNGCGLEAMMTSGRSPADAASRIARTEPRANSAMLSARPTPFPWYSRVGMKRKETPSWTDSPRRFGHCRPPIRVLAVKILTRTPWRAQRLPSSQCLHPVPIPGPPA
jgi:hypothetical protein